MGLRNSPTGYGLIARCLHWLTALFMLPSIAIAVFLDTLSEDAPDDLGARRPAAPVRSFLAMALIAVGLWVPTYADDGDSFASAFIRLAIVVSDLERSQRFYQYALGYQVRFSGDITRPIVLTQMGLSDHHTVQFAVLASRDTPAAARWPSAAMIGLLAVDPALPVMTRPEGADLAIGEGMLAVMTTDMDQVYSRLLELDTRILLPPMASPDGSERELVFHDPDGIRIHVVERRADARSDVTD